MAYCEPEGPSGLGALPAHLQRMAVKVLASNPQKATAYLAQSNKADVLLDPRYKALLAAKIKPAEPPPPVHPSGNVPPPAPTEVLPPSSPLPQPEGPRPRPDFSLAPAQLVPSGGGGVGPISVSVSPGLVDPTPTAAPAGKGFGMVEAALAAGVAAILGMALSRRNGKR